MAVILLYLPSPTEKLHGRWPYLAALRLAESWGHCTDSAISQKVDVDSFFFFFRALQSINPTDYSALFCFTEPLQSDIPVNNKLLMNQTSTELVSPSCFVPRQSKSLSDLVWWEKLLTHSAPIDKQFRNEGRDKKLPKKTWLKMTGRTPGNAAPWLQELFGF